MNGYMYSIVHVQEHLGVPVGVKHCTYSKWTSTYMNMYTNMCMNMYMYLYMGMEMDITPKS
jgi:hypothetical protein